VGEARVWFSDSQIALAAAGARPVTISFPKARIAAIEPLASRSHYFRPGRQQSGVPHFARLRYESVYPGIDLVFYGNPSQLECDFVAQPWADPRAIRLRFSIPVARDRTGDVIAGGVRFHRPIARQNGRIVSSEFRTAGNVVTLAIGRYDRSRPLTIDPQIIFSTYLGGGGPELLHSVATDSDGSIYIAGQTDSPDFPTLNAEQPASLAYGQVFVTKFDKAGALVFSTYVGGSSNDAAWGIAVDGNHNIYVTGNAHSPDFPLVNPIQGSLAAQGPQAGDPTAIDAFVFKLSADGSKLLYSTYLGGNDHDFGEAIAVDGDGAAYVVGQTESTDFAVTLQAIQPSPPVSPRSANGFVTKLNASGSALVYSTYLSGSDGSVVWAVAADSAGNAVVAGETASRDLPVANALISSAPLPLSPDYPNSVLSTQTYSHAFVSKLNADGSALIYSTYLGGDGQSQALGVTTDAAGNAYVTGGTGTVHFVMRDDAPQYLAGAIFLKSTNGGAAWQAFRNGLLVSAVTSIATDPSNPGVLYAGTHEGVFKSADGGQNWSLSGLREYSFSSILIDPHHSSTVYALAGGSVTIAQSGVFYGAFRSTDAGATWQPFAAALGSAPQNFLFDPTDANAIYAVGGGLFKSLDGDATWTNVGPTTQGEPAAVSSAAIDPANPSILYAAIPSAFCGVFCGIRPGAVFKSTDGGQTWAMKQAIRTANVMVDPNSPSTVYADNLKSTDGGETWTQLGGSEFVLAIDSNSNVYGYSLSASPTQIQMSSDGGQNWTAVYDAKGSSPLAGFAVDPNSAGTLYVGGAAQADAFVVKLSSAGDLIYTKFLGGSGADHASAVAVDSSGAVYLAGMTASQDFPAVGPVLPYSAPLANFAARLDAATFAPTFSTFLGASASYPGNGVAVDADGNMIVVGSTGSPNLPAVNAVRPQLDGATDAFVIKVELDY
jgi:photosystem II stability/assembly factor-like uncharacterized protein